ncbi:TonB family protein [Erythrobacter sp. F6033]|uniref:TonB family protein n=1 Tax=Erythrobacter sp. F6033 TaxID=2926401 RepID=UPI001FF669CE|nr:TonB family protein [Erythrobacter sp. F6033]MCK0129355.1 energy transducer TonB [Erythrobacter sp. F6033]
MTHAKTRYSGALRRPRWWVIVLIVLLHIAALYGLGRALAPEFTGSIERTVVSAFTVTITAPPDPPPPENKPEPDQGAQGDQGKQAVPKPVTAPKSEIKTNPTPVPQASSTGTANRSGARDTGDGTGAAGSGVGTGSGNSGGGQGGIAVSKPVHISGSIQNARDYPTPPGGREARRGTEVIVRVTVGINGRASGCSVYRPSPDAEADRITCELVENRLRFRPAMDANGNPVAAPFYWRQRWF